MLGKAPPILNLNFDRSPTVQKFHESPAFVRGLMGPVGSGKSVGCCFELFHIACTQWPNNQGVRKSRFIVVRNTSPQLETTTIKTWTEWFPEEVFGKISRKAPFTQMMKFRLSDGTQVESEVIFLALDQPEDIKKLLSFECTAIWYNEAREIDKSLVDAGTGRVGRYPSKKDIPDELIRLQADAVEEFSKQHNCYYTCDFFHESIARRFYGQDFENAAMSKDEFDKKIRDVLAQKGISWPTRACIIMDTNPPNDDHWWFDYAENDGWRRDPESGMMRDLESLPVTDRWAFFRQPGGRTPQAENLQNLSPGYYQRQMLGKDADYIRVMIDGDYGMLQAGQPVYKASFNKELHVNNDVIGIDRRAITYIGVDSSGRNPSAVFGQWNDDRTQLRIVRELVCQDMGAEIFAQMLKRVLNEEFAEGDKKAWGDPAGTYKSNSDERTYFDIVRKNAGLTLLPAPVLRIQPRIESVRGMFMRLTYGGRPAIIISPNCKVLISGLSGGYKFRQLKVSGEARYHEEPEKNRYSDVQDALQYLVCGLGEYKNLTGRGNHATQPAGNIADIGEWRI